MSGILSHALPTAALRAVVDRAGAPELAMQGPPAARALAIAALAAPDGGDRPVLAVAATGREVEALTAALGDLLGTDAVAALPSWETLPHERLSPRADTVGKRVDVLHRLAGPGNGGLRVVVTAVRSLIQPMAPGLGSLAPVELRVGEEQEFDATIARLVDLAYARVDMVEKRGEFAVRGGILDVFPPTARHPYRVEFWGDEVSEIRTFAVADQRSLPEEISEITATACRELLLTADVKERAAELAAEHEADAARGVGPSERGAGAGLSEMLTKIASGIPVEGMEALIPVLLPGELELLTDAMPAGTHVVMADPEKIRARAQDLVRTGQEFLEASWMVAADGGRAPIDLGASAYRDLGEIERHARDTGRCWWTLSQLTSEGAGVLDVGVGAVPGYRGDLAQVATDLRAHTAASGAAVLVVAGGGTAARAVEQLSAAEVPVTLATDGVPEAPAAGLVTVTTGNVTEGFTVPDAALVVLSEADVTGRGAAAGRSAADMGIKMPSRRRNAVDPLALKPGDYVVHDQHGIGKFVEMVQRTVTGATREYLLLEYASSKRGHPGDRLFVPTDQLDEVSRYVGGELPTLNKLGGSDWKNTKARARKAVKEIAAELVQLYAARQAAPGYAFGADTPWQAELEDAFPFIETTDQLAAIDEVKVDMRRGVPMDRVICGDVGYGKTEIAVRAAFKAVQDGKQVVVLVPTTLLAQQHLSTFLDRMSAFPVTVKGLSRFTHADEAEQTIAALADGEVDVVIGTHRLLQTGIRYKDLGLVIVDEEQRFGVEHKEHIKALRTHVDVLTMSATPIPRTLEMSLAGIREMSTILTPPEDRHPILTYVGAYDDKQVAAAIHRELLRDGQVFYVHNRVKSIEKAAKRLRELAPEARVVTAHGQMNEDKLEKVIEGFWENEYDVLVCTTIVETGLDISNANTLIVERGDLLGLAQLHQLRGRVGRSRERGYAYFLYPGETPLTETAHDRLATIAQNTELGAGMAVAMKDLEIRGAGNILGAEQSGHIAGVGFDLYVRLVGEAVQEYRAFSSDSGDEPAGEESPADVRVDLPIDAHIPHDYVPGERLRLEAYRKIAAAGDPDALATVREELVDRYGRPPAAVGRLLAVAEFRQLCRASGVTEVSGQGNNIRFAPMELADSQLVRLKRLYPKATYKAVTNTVAVPRPTEGPAGGRIGAPPLRDNELLDWCGQFLRLMAQAPVPAV
ncbi:MAG: transcription-repair coupling factor [Actinophytocola sp.]|nr:transcription-repair coupling factor [Actinophytocola sp.]